MFRTDPGKTQVGSVGDESTTSSVLPAFHSGPCEQPLDAPAEFSEELNVELEKLRVEVEAEWAEGWKRVQLQDLDGGWTCGWARSIESALPGSDGPSPVSGNPIYGTKDLAGEVIGYEVLYVGFVSRDVVEAPGFDPAVLRVEKNGCDPLASQDCRPRT